MSVNLINFIKAFADQYQDLEYAFQDLKTGVQLNNAIGVQLDGIGDLVGIPRFTDDDNLYRTAIRFQISLNNSNGTPEDIISFLQQQTSAVTSKYQTSKPLASPGCIIL